MTPQPPRNPRTPRGRRLAAIFALATLATLLIGQTPGPHVAQLRGQVEIGSGDPPSFRPARAGDALAPGDVVRTGHDGRAELVLAAGTLRLYGDTLLRLPTASAVPGSADAVELDAGSSLFDILRRGRDEFEVRTPEVVVSIKGTRFLVVAEERAEVAVFHGTVGLRSEMEPARELLVREGFAAVGEPGRPFELIVNAAPDPWDGWLDGGAPPRAPETAASSSVQTATLIESAKKAARARARGSAVEQASDRHPGLLGRLGATLAGDGRQSDANGDSPAALDVNAVDGSDGLLEVYVESLLNGDPGGNGPVFEITALGNEVVLTRDDGLVITLDETQLVSVAEGLAPLRAPIANTPGVVLGGTQQVVGGLLGLIKP